MELWDGYDAQFHKIDGVTLIRGEPIPGGVFHLVCDILVRHTDGTYLLMKRDPRKHLGGMWEASAGGSALRGESPLACARRELEEETGIREGTFTQLGTIVDPEKRAIYVEFLCVTHGKKDAIAFQEGETVDFRWVSRKTLLATELATHRMQRFSDLWEGAAEL